MKSGCFFITFVFSLLVKTTQKYQAMAIQNTNLFVLNMVNLLNEELPFLV